MENGTDGEEILTTTTTEIVSDVVKSTREVKETTEIEVKSSTVFVKSESSQLSTSTITTEPILLNNDVLALEDVHLDPLAVSQEPSSDAVEQVNSSPSQENGHEPQSESVLDGTIETTQEIKAEQLEQKEEQREQVEEKKEETEERNELVDQIQEQVDIRKETEIVTEETKQKNEETNLQNEDLKVASSETAEQITVPQSEEKEKETNVEKQETPSQTQKEEKGSAIIQEESIKNQLHEIINEIDMEVSKTEDGFYHHTWQPKGHYEIKKTEIEYEDVVACQIPDVQEKERAKASSKPPKQQQQNVHHQEQHQELNEELNEDIKREFSIDAQKFLRHTVINGEPISPLEIPIGIPLLAKILPREESGDEEPREKITLERLFTPATDTEEIGPQKKKKAYASSCFYRPDHPTIDDQVELAHKISVSLIDENNKSSKGQTMYMKRKNRSSKWIHQGEEAEIRAAYQCETEEVEEEKKPSLEKPKLKLLMNPKGIQDYNAVQRHYEELMSSSTESTQHLTRMEVGKDIATQLESPTGKGAALFAKRKKRMDKFIVDETTVQQQHQQQLSNSVHEEITTSVTQQNSTSYQNSSQIIQHSTSLNGPSIIEAPLIQEGVAIYTAEVKVVQKPSLSTQPIMDVPAPVPIQSTLDQFAARKDEEKRKSFNLAPKGWGTYNNFYTPIHLGAQ